MNLNLVYVLLAVLTGLVSGLILFFVLQSKLKNKKLEIERNRVKVIDDSQKEADSIKKEATLKQKISSIRQRPRLRKRYGRDVQNSTILTSG